MIKEIAINTLIVLAALVGIVLLVAAVGGIAVGVGLFLGHIPKTHGPLRTFDLAVLITVCVLLFFALVAVFVSV